MKVPVSPRPPGPLALGLLLAFLPAAGVPGRATASDATLERRGPDTMIASELGAIAVVTPAGEPLGDVSDTILSHDGRVVALVIGVGGFLGLGEKPVAVAWRYLDVRTATRGDGFEIVCTLDRAALERAPAYRERER